MSEVGNIVSGFYSDFVLRDLLSFVTPGAILLGSILFLILPLNYLIHFFNNLNWILYIFLFGLCYIIGFGLMMVGEFLGQYLKFLKGRYLTYYKESPESQQKRLLGFYESLTNQNTKDKLSKIRERYVVFMQSCGNCCVALIFSIILFIVKLVFIYNILTNYTFLFHLSPWYFFHLKNEIVLAIVLTISMILLFVVLDYGYCIHKGRLKSWDDFVIGGETTHYQ
jgi:hypothetical protein